MQLQEISKVMKEEDTNSEIICNSIDIKINIPNMPKVDVDVRFLEFVKLFTKTLKEKSINLEDIIYKSNKNTYNISGKIYFDEYVIIKGPKIGSSNIDNFKNQFNGQQVIFFEKDCLFYAKKKQENIQERLINLIMETIKRHAWSIKMTWNTGVSCVRPIKYISVKINNDFIYGNFHNVLFKEDDNIVTDFKEIENTLMNDFQEITNLKLNTISLEDQYKKDHNNTAEPWSTISCKVLAESNYANLINPKIIKVEIDEKFNQLPEALVSHFLLENHETGLIRMNHKYYALYCYEKDVDIELDSLKLTFESKLIDALYLFKIDTKRSIDFYLEKNKNKRFFNFTVQQKSKLVFEIAQNIAKLNNLNIDMTLLEEIAKFYKLDVCSETVSEYPHLEGIITEALLKKENYNSKLIDIVGGYTYYEKEEDRINRIEAKNSKEAILIKISDRIYNLSVLSDFLPTGDGDPCGLKADANFIIENLITNNWNLDLNIFEKSREFFEKRYLNVLYKKNESLKHINTDLQNLKNFINFNLDLHTLDRVKKLISKGNFNDNIELNYEEKLISTKLDTLDINTYHEISNLIANYLDKTIINPYIERKNLLEKYLNKSSNFIKI